MVWLLISLLVSWVLVAEWRVSRLTHAVRHHEHVIRLALDSLDAAPGVRFARMVLDEKAWDERDRLVNRPPQPAKEE